MGIVGAGDLAACRADGRGARAMTEASALGIASAFAAGAVSFLSPCVLPLVPGYVSYLAGQPAALAYQHLAQLVVPIGFAACRLAPAMQAAG